MALRDIFEKKYDQSDFRKTREELMTPEEIDRVNFYLEKYDDGKSAMEERLEEWEEIQTAYKGERTDVSENGAELNPVAVNILIAQIEGQVSSMMNNSITGSYKGIGHSDQQFAATAGIVGDFILKQNKAKNLVKQTARQYLKYGNCFVSVRWDADGFNGFGLPIIDVPKPGTIIVDDKITDIVNDLQRADYIIEEVGSRSIIWARRKYGDEIADAIVLGNNREDFEYQDTDTDESFTYLRVWTKNNEQENLQLLEISLCGILLEESEPSRPYYRHVFNKYPIFSAGLYKDESDSYYFGDGKILLPMQKLINKLYDEIILAVKFASQGRTYVDPASRLNPVEFAQADPSVPIYVKNPQQMIKTERGAGLNEVVLSLVANILDKVQETTRFSALMTGNDPSRGMTATQAGIQMQQGATGIDDKKGDLSQMLGEAVNYSLGLCMQFWDAAKAFRVADNDDQFEWIDTRQLKSIPELIPASSDFIKNWSKNNPKNKDKPEYMALEIETDETDEEGNRKKTTATKEIELDVIVNIGEGLPNNKIALYNMVLSLAQVVLPDEITGQPKPLIGLSQFRRMVENYLGIKIDEEDNEQAMLQMQQQMMAQQPQTPQPLNISPNVPGANQNGTAMRGGMNG